MSRGVKAGDVVKVAAGVVGGGGGGRDTIAQAGGREPAKLPEALDAGARRDRVRPRRQLRCARVLALDYGSARCGCALSDPTGMLATPIEPVLRPGDAARDRRGSPSWCASARWSVSSSASRCGCRARHRADEEARAFAARLAERLGPSVPVELYDERLTTVQALRDPAGDASLDSRAAAHLLEAWLASGSSAAISRRLAAWSTSSSG